MKLTDIKFFQILYHQNPTLCSNCGSPIEYKNRHGKYCSKKCAAEINNKLSPKRKKDFVDHVQLEKKNKIKIKNNQDQN